MPSDDSRAESGRGGPQDKEGSNIPKPCPDCGAALNHYIWGTSCPECDYSYNVPRLLE